MVKTRMMFNGEDVAADELEFEPLSEKWNEYRLEDGTLLRWRTNVVKVTKVEGRFTAEGDPIYYVQTANALTVSAPPHLKKLTKDSPQA